jgi:hypothetical protein
MALRVLQLQHRLAIEKVVTRKKQIEPDEIFPQHSNFRVVKLGKKRRHRIRAGHYNQTRQQLRQSRSYFGQLLHRSIWRRHARIQFQIEDITFRVDSLGRSVRAWRRLDTGMKCDAVEQTTSVQFAADRRRPRRRRFRRWRSWNFPRPEVLQSLLRNPAIQDHDEHRRRQNDYQPSQRAQTKLCHAFTFSTRRQLPRPDRSRSRSTSGRRASPCRYG